jgi:hypothetical protein
MGIDQGRVSDGCGAFWKPGPVKNRYGLRKTVLSGVSHEKSILPVNLQFQSQHNVKNSNFI